MLEIKNLSKSYGQGENRVEVLKAMDLKVDDSETVAILGPSGSGKSTFLSMVSGLDKPTSGHVILRGQNLEAMSQEDVTAFRGKNIGIVFQQFHLVPTLTALENVMLPLQIAGETDCETPASELLSRVGLGERLNHFPHQLSGGENQRVAIARALVTSPGVLLADEPSGNLDERIGREVMDLLFEVVQEKKATLLLVTHNETLAKRCHRQLHLKDGRFS